MLTSLIKRVARLLPWVDEDDTTTIWDLTPSEQYGGRLAEAGGITKGEQETALRDVQDQATEIERNLRK